MTISSALVWFFVLGVLLAVASAVIARAAARDARSILRRVTLDLDQLFIESERQGMHIKRLTGAVGSLGRWNTPKTDPNAPPDPTTDPDKWRAWVRRSVKPNLGELQ